MKDTDWKKLWQRAGQQKSPNNVKVDNNIDSTDTSMMEDNEVNIVIFSPYCIETILGNIELFIVFLNKEALFVSYCNLILSYFIG